MMLGLSKQPLLQEEMGGRERVQTIVAAWVFHWLTEFMDFKLFRQTTKMEKVSVSKMGDWPKNMVALGAQDPKYEGPGPSQDIKPSCVFRRSALRPRPSLAPHPATPSAKLLCLAECVGVVSWQGPTCSGSRYLFVSWARPAKNISFVFGL